MTLPHTTTTTTRCCLFYHAPALSLSTRTFVPWCAPAVVPRVLHASSSEPAPGCLQVCAWQTGCPKTSTCFSETTLMHGLLEVSTENPCSQVYHCEVHDAPAYFPPCTVTRCDMSLLSLQVNRLGTYLSQTRWEQEASKTDSFSHGCTRTISTMKKTLLHTEGGQLCKLSGGFRA
jgi:hypothetical protein